MALLLCPRLGCKLRKGGHALPMGQSQPTGPCVPVRLTRSPLPDSPGNSAVSCGVPRSSLEKGDIKNEGGPEATLTIKALGASVGKRLIEVTFNFAREKMFVLCGMFLKDVSRPSRRSVFRQLIHLTTKTQTH